VHTLAALAALEHQLSLLARAIRQPPAAAIIAPGDLLQLSPDADATYGSYFLLASNVSHGRARGPLLTYHRASWRNVALDHLTRIGAAAWPTPALGFIADPHGAALEILARSTAYAADVARTTALRAETIRRKKAG
jgi:hypothetical protein